MLTDDVDQVLHEYFRWARANCPSDVTFPHSDPMARLRGSSVPSVQMSDDEAAHVDKLICHLRDCEPELHKVLMWVYADRKTLRWLAARGRGSRVTLARQLGEARQFIRGGLLGNFR